MMVTTKVDLDAAAETWLEAYENYQNYLTATEMLFRVFSEGWRGRRSLTEAFDSYREALLRESGHSVLELRKVYPPRRPECQ